MTVRLRSGFGLRLDHQRQTIQEVTHPGRQRVGELVERAANVALERRRGEALHQRSRKVDRRQLGQSEPGVVQPPERALLERPVLLAVVNFIEQRKACGLKRLEIAPNGPGRYTGSFGEIVDRDAP